MIARTVDAVTATWESPAAMGTLVNFWATFVSPLAKVEVTHAEEAGTKQLGLRIDGL